MKVKSVLVLKKVETLTAASRTSRVSCISFNTRTKAAMVDVGTIRVWTTRPFYARYGTCIICQFAIPSCKTIRVSFTLRN